MKVVNPVDTTHNVDIIPRFYPTEALTMVMYNEATQESSNPTVSYWYSDGYMSFEFDFEFTEGKRYQFQLSEGINVVYVGKFIATTQESQEYKQTNDLYYYE